MDHGVLAGSKRLTALYLSQTPDLPNDCREAVTGNEGRFLVWPSTAEGALALMPAGLPHAAHACADTALLPTDLLRAEGFASGLPDALDHPAPIRAR